MNLNARLGSIVAIHGLDGHCKNSWTADNGVLWLRDLLPDQIPSARILTYGYDADTRGKDILSSLTLHSHAETFVAKLTLFRKTTSVRSAMFGPKIAIIYIFCPRRKSDPSYS
jgi:hypothetical protein